MLPADRVIYQGTTHHEHERVAWEWLRSQLPGHGPYRAAAFFELPDGGGRLYDIDALVIGSNAIYLLEMKDWRGQIRSLGGSDWIINQDGHTFTRENPYSLINLKARVLASLLERKGHMARRHRPRVEGLVFLTHPDVRAELHGADLQHVVTRHNVMQALSSARFPGADPRLTTQRIESSMSRKVAKALEQVGVIESQGARRIGDTLLLEELAHGPGYVDWRGEDEFRRMPFRVRCYQHRAGADDDERRDLVASAQREASLLTRLGDHKHILRAVNAVSEGPHGGPAVVFDWLEDGQPLWSYLQSEGQRLGLSERLSLVEQIASALRFAHDKGVVHRGLSPRTVWIATDVGGRPSATLIDFQLARHHGGTATSGTVHLTRHSADDDAVYRAPELLQDPGFDDPRVDVYSLGALAWLILTGRPPAASHSELVQAVKERRLSLAAVQDDLMQTVATDLADEHRQFMDDIFYEALAVHLDERADKPVEWVEHLLEAATAPDIVETDSGEVDPLEANKGDRLAGGFVVEGVLGAGTTGRALRVSRGGESMVLKVPLQPDFTARLIEESRQLERLHQHDLAGCSHIVQSLGMPLIGGVDGLLLTDAGDTLADLLRQQGPPPLEYAQRWGDHLLLALEALEAANVLHRDVKPANIGVGGRKEHLKVRLKLFDFSLAAVPRDAIRVGTEAYMDPWAERRGAVDATVDRYATAVTLYELVAGVRPRPPAGVTQHVADVPLEVDADRFDPAVRVGLARFFEQAFRPDAGERHASAEQMRREWGAAFSPAAQGVAQHREETTDATRQTGPLSLGALHLDDPLTRLGLSGRAANALDRAGATTVADLLALPRNRLSMIRGVGARTSGELYELAERIRAANPQWRDGSADLAQWLPEYVGPDAAVEFITGLPTAAARRLQDAGLGRVGALVSAPACQVDHLLGKDGTAAATLRDWLQAASEGRLDDAAPATIEAWVQALVPDEKTEPKRKRRHQLRVFLGLDEERGGYAVAGMSDAAARLKVSRQRVFQVVGDYRERWCAHPQLEVLRNAVVAAIDQLGGLASLAEAGQTLARLIPHAPASEARDDEDGSAQALASERARHARALVRIAAESDADVSLAREGRQVWVARAEGSLACVRPLGAAADELARREPLPASAVVHDELRTLVEGTPLSAMSSDRLARLAAEASEQAAVSARGELYPRGLPAERAARLISTALSRAVMPIAEVQQAVYARYPEAAALPGRPALDAILAGVGLSWSAQHGAYVRRDMLQRTRSSTMKSLTRLRTVGTSTRIHRGLTEEEVWARDFEDRLRLAVEHGGALVVEVVADRADEARLALAARLGALAKRPVAPVALDLDLLAHARDWMRARSVQQSAVWQADAGGPAHKAWPLLLKLMRAAAEAQLTALHAATAPRLLDRPGLLARYRLEVAADGLVGASRPDDAGCTILLLATEDRTEPGGLVRSAHPDIADLELPAPTNRRALLPLAWIKQHKPTTQAAQA